METRKKLKKSDLEAKIQSISANFDSETATIDGEEYARLYERSKELESAAQTLPAEDEAGIAKLDADITAYEAALQQAQQNRPPETPPVRQELPVEPLNPPAAVAAPVDAPVDAPAEAENDNINMDEVNHVCNELDESYTDSADYLLAMSTVALVSASDRLLVPQLKLKAENIKAWLLKTQGNLDVLIGQANAVNNQEAKRQAALIQNRIEKARELKEKVAKSETKLGDISDPQTHFGYYANKEIDSDAAEYVAAADVQAKLAAYFSREKNPAEQARFEITSSEGNAFPGRTLYKVENKDNTKPVRIVLSSIKDDKQNLSRYAMLQYHEEDAKRFLSQVHTQGIPKNIKDIEDDPGFLKKKTSIPGREMMIFAHDAIENHRMADTLYPGTKLTFSMRNMPQRLVDAVALYCMHMKYDFEIVHAEPKVITREELDLLQKSLAKELRDMALNRLVASSPQVVEQTFARTEPPQERPQMRV